MQLFQRWRLRCSSVLEDTCPKQTKPNQTKQQQQQKKSQNKTKKKQGPWDSLHVQILQILKSSTLFLCRWTVPTFSFPTFCTRWIKVLVHSVLPLTFWWNWARHFNNSQELINHRILESQSWKRPWRLPAKIQLSPPTGRKLRLSIIE